MFRRQRYVTMVDDHAKWSVLIFQHFFSEFIMRSIISLSHLLCCSMNLAADRLALFFFSKLILVNIWCLAVSCIGILQYATLVYSWLHWRFRLAFMVTVEVSIPRIKVDEKSKTWSRRSPTLPAASCFTRKAALTVIPGVAKTPQIGICPITWEKGASWWNSFLYFCSSNYRSSPVRAFTKSLE